MASACESVVPYIDLPLQHGADSMLRRMSRPGSRASYERLLLGLRERLPEVTLRTTFIVGFPGETAAEFDELCDFVRKVEFDHVGVFTYSHEEGTAAHALGDDVPARTKASRQRRLMAIQQGIVARRHEARLGQRVEVLVDGPSPEHDLVLQGRLAGQAPEIDPVVYLTDCDPERVRPGEFVAARNRRLAGIRPGRAAARMRPGGRLAAQPVAMLDCEVALPGQRPSGLVRAHSLFFGPGRGPVFEVPAGTGRGAVWRGSGWAGRPTRFPGREMADDRRLAGIRAAADRVARSNGVEVFEVQLRREPVGLVLRIFIDRPARVDERGVVLADGPEHAIGIEDCQRVSEELSAIFDVEDALESAYTLEVSSPGLERPLREARDYHRFAGRMAKIVVRQALDGQMHFEGRLRGVEDGSVVLEVGRRKIARLPLDNIVRGRLVVEF